MGPTWGPYGADRPHLGPMNLNCYLGSMTRSWRQPYRELGIYMGIFLDNSEIVFTIYVPFHKFMSLNNIALHYILPKYTHIEMLWLPRMVSYYQTEISPFWRKFRRWLHRKLSTWQLPMHSVTKISPKWLHFHFTVCERGVNMAQSKSIQTWTKGIMGQSKPIWHMQFNLVPISCKRSRGNHK